MLQMARQEQQLEQKARSGQSKPEELRGEQSAVKQGARQRGAEAAAGRTEDVAALRPLAALGGGSAAEGRPRRCSRPPTRAAAQQAASSLGEAADALNRAAASLARDREKANYVAARRPDSPR